MWTKRFYIMILQCKYTVCIEDNPINYIINKKQIQTIKIVEISLKNIKKKIKIRIQKEISINERRKKNYFVYAGLE